MSSSITAQDIINFWFNELTPADWWKKSNDLDNLISTRFQEIHSAAASLELAHWRTDHYGRLAEIIILDQFSRNMFRDQVRSFTYDGIALALSQEAINSGEDQNLSATEKSFLYMPFMHSESLTIHDKAVMLFEQNGLEHNLDFEHQHRNIIKRFGRYPHRNEILGRESTPEEKEFLLTKGSSF